MTTPTPDTLEPGHPLAGAEAKIRRAREHHDSYNEEVDAIRNADPSPVGMLGQAVQDDRGQVWWQIVIHEVDPPPLRMATIVGDHANNLRSALDHLVFELSFLGKSGAPPGANVQWPFCQDSASWVSPHVQTRMLDGVLEEHRQVIERLQPYNQPDLERHPLTLLQAVSNDDKHRVVQPVLLAPTSIAFGILAAVDCTIAGDWILNGRLFGRPLNVGDELARVPITVTGPNPTIEVEGHDSELVVGLRDGYPFGWTMAAMGSAVGQIVAVFVPVFETPEARALWAAARPSRIADAPLPDPAALGAKVIKGGARVDEDSS